MLPSEGTGTMKLVLPRSTAGRGILPGRAWSVPQVRMALASLILGAFWIPGVYPSRNDAGALNREDLSRSLAASPLTQEQKAFHVLSRLAFGPRPGDVEK